MCHSTPHLSATITIRRKLKLKQHPRICHSNDFLVVFETSVLSSCLMPSIDRSSAIVHRWHGRISCSSDLNIPCQSTTIYGDSHYLLADVSERLFVLGRLRLTELWDYVRDSLPVRDVLILTLVSPCSIGSDDDLFAQYVQKMRRSNRAAVITKRPDLSSIRDMYILASDTDDCPSNVLSTLAMPATTCAKELFLVIIGSGKRTMKVVARPTDSLTWNNLTYKPISLNEATTIRDPRLLKHKDAHTLRSGLVKRLTDEDITALAALQSNDATYKPSFQ